jgi:molybdopterin converting factor small subunit
MNDAKPRVRVLLPAALRPLCLGRAEVVGEGRTVGEVVRGLRTSYPRLGERLLDGEGRARRYVSLFLGDEDVRQLGGLEAAVADGDVLTVVPAIAGGARCR